MRTTIINQTVMRSTEGDDDGSKTDVDPSVDDTDTDPDEQDDDEDSRN